MTHQKAQQRTLVGRQAQFQELSNLLIQSSIGNKRLCLISGDPGIGKSALVRNLRTPTEEMKGIFAEGKCNLYETQPYDAIKKSIGAVVEQIYQRPSEDIAQIKRDIEETVGLAASVLRNVIPSISPLISDSHELEDTDAFDFEATFQFAILQCIRIFQEHAAPLVLFIDDVQWIDQSSIRVIQMIMDSDELNRLFIVLSYRTSESTPSESFLENIQSLLAQGSSILLSNLSQSDVNTLIDLEFGQMEPRSRLLTEIVYQKAHGNPFFTIHLLDTLRQSRNLIQDSSGVWRWVFDAVSRMPISDNASEFIDKQLAALPYDQLSILQFLSCFGNDCTANIIAECLPSVTDAVSAINSLTRKGFILAKDGGLYALCHDRISHSAHNTLSANELSQIHWNIGQILRQNDSEWIDKHITTVVSHLNKGSAHIKSTEMAETVIRMNLTAAKNARYSIAFSEALGYAKTAYAISQNTTLMPDLSYHWRYKILFESATCAKLAHDFEAMERFLNEIDSFATSEDSFKALEIRISAFIYQNEHEKAWAAFRSAAKPLGIDLPLHGSKALTLLEVAKTEFALRRCGIDNIANLPQCHDKKLQLICRLFAVMFPPLFMNRPDLLAIMVFQWVRLILKTGLTPDSTTALSAYATILVSHLRKTEKGVNLGEVVLRLIEQSNHENYAKYRALTVLTNTVLHLNRRWIEFTPIAKLCFSRCLQLGDHEFASLAVSSIIYFPYEDGAKLDVVLDLYELYLNKIKAISPNFSPDHYHRMYARCCMLKGIPNKHSGKGGINFEADYDTLVESLKDRPPTLHTAKMDRQLDAYLRNDICTAYQIGSTLFFEKLLPGSVTESSIAFMTFLAGDRLLSGETAHSLKLSEIRRVLRLCFRRISDFNAFETGTNLHRHRALQALRLAQKNNHPLADEYFNQAIRAAEENSYLCDSGMINELYARFLLRSHYIPDSEINGMSREAAIKKKAGLVLRAAINNHEKWGATRLSRIVFSRYNDIIDIDEKPLESSMTTGDYSAVLPQIKRISQLRELSDCIDTLPKILFELIVDAHHYVFLMLDNSKASMKIVGHYGLNEHSVRSLAFSDAIIETAVRTRQIAFVGNTSIEPGLALDPFLSAEKVASYYSIPMLSHNNVTGVVYVGSQGKLQNNRNIMNQLQLIATQAGGALTNAILLDGLKASESQLRMMYNNSPTGMIRIAQNGVITSYNDRIREWFDTSISNSSNPETIWNSPWIECLKLKDMFLSQQDAATREHHISTLSKGRTLHLSVSCKPAYDSAHSIDFSITDNTETVEWQRETQNRRLAEEKVRASADFITNMTHELRTPLAIITGMLKPLLQRDLANNPEIEQAVETALNNALRLQKLVSDLLEISRSGNDQKIASQKATNFSAIALSTCHDLKNFIATHEERDLRVNIQNDVIVDGHTEDFVRIIFNLVHNSYKFTSADNGQISVTLRTKEQFAILTISDNGVGIPEADQPFIFDRFYQSANNTSSEAGLGIGLSLVRELVSRNNGAIELKSSPGKGTSFTIQFPLSITPADCVNSESSSLHEISEIESSSFLREKKRQLSISAKQRILLLTDNCDLFTQVKQAMSAFYFIEQETSATSVTTNTQSTYAYIFIDNTWAIDKHIVLPKDAQKVGLIITRNETPAIEGLRTFQWPFALPEVLSHIQIPLDEHSDEKQSILIVDDEPDIIQVLSGYLAGEYTIRTATNGLDGLKELERSEPALMLLDLKMPVMDGMTTLKTLKESANRTRVLVLTTDDDKATDALSLGADDFCPKNIAQGELLARCRNLVRSYMLEQHLLKTHEDLLSTNEELRSTQTSLILAEKSASIEHIGKSVLHELNNPLSIALQSLQFAKSVADEGTLNPDDIVSLNDAIKESLEMQSRMIGIVRTFSEFADSGKSGEINAESLPSVINDALTLNKYDLAGITVITEVDDIRVMCNKAQIIQVLSNFISNTKKAFDITARKSGRRIEVRTHRSANRIQISYKDNGPGISEEDQQLIFGAFFSRFKAGVASSSGLGLHICKTILNRHDSTLQVRSDGQSFTEFLFDLNMEEQDAEQTPDTTTMTRIRSGSINA